MNSPKHSRASAPYGQACTNCVKAKCRCMVFEGGTCERCHRLGKACSPPASVRKGTTKRTTAAKRSQLEDKLEDLVSLLRSQHAGSQNDRPAFPQVPTPHSSEPSPHQAWPESPCGHHLTTHEFAMFRDLHLPSFPLIHLPPNLTAEELQADKPLVSMAIQTICNKAVSQQSKLSKRLREIMALQLLVEGEKNIDLLLAMLMCMAWSIYFTAGKQMLGMYAGIARSLVCNLRLDRPKRPGWCPGMGPNSVNTSLRSLESRRAILACYALSGIVSTTLNYDITPWSSQLDDDCTQLASEAESDGDTILISIAQITRIGMQVAEVNQSIYDKRENRKLATLHIEPLKSSLDLLMSTLSVQQTQHSTVLAYLYSTEISIYKLAIAPSKLSSTTIIDHRRTGYMLNCLQSCKSCTEKFIAAGIDFIYGTVAWKLLFAYCAKILHKLSVAQDACWDPSIVRNTVDIVGLLEQVAAGSDECNAKLREETGEDSVFAMAAKTLRDTAPEWLVPHAPAATELTGWQDGQSLDLPFVDFPDDFWLSGLFNP